MNKDILSQYHNNNPEKFNDDFIRTKEKDYDYLLDYIDQICKALEILDGVTYLGSTLDTDESNYYLRGKEDAKYHTIEESRMNRVKVKFHLDKDDESQEVEKYLLFPKYIKNSYFVINDTKYFPIYQIVDSATYKTAHGLTLKTMLMPIRLMEKKATYYDIDNNEYNIKYKIIVLFTNRINILYYYFAKMGVTDTIKYFGLGKDAIKLSASSLSGKGYISFLTPYGTYVNIQEEYMNKDHPVYNFILNFIEIFMSQKSLLMTDMDWKERMSTLFKNTKKVEKIDKILLSFERILDVNTKNNLILNDESIKEDIYSIVKFMLLNYSQLRNRDNLDLCNKRIRVIEYLLYPLVLKFSKMTYRLLNRNEIKMYDLEKLFTTLYPTTLSNHVATNDLIRNYNAVNGIDLFNEKLKFSIRGPQALGSGSSDIQVEFRDLHPSFVGRIGLATSSNSDPGATGSFTPFNVMDNMYYFNGTPFDEFKCQCEIEDDDDEV